MNSEAVTTQIPLWLVYAVVGVALAIGATMIAAVVGKYVLRQWFHVVGGPILTLLGVVLIGLTVHGNVKLKAGDFEAEFNRLNRHIAFLESTLDESREQIAHLGKTLGRASSKVRAVSAAFDMRINTTAGQPWPEGLKAAREELRALDEAIVQGTLDAYREYNEPVLGFPGSAPAINTQP